jgi:hypothetical protein
MVHVVNTTIHSMDSRMYVNSKYCTVIKYLYFLVLMQ